MDLNKTTMYLTEEQLKRQNDALQRLADSQSAKTNFALYTEKEEVRKAYENLNINYRQFN